GVWNLDRAQLGTIAICLCLQLSKTTARSVVATLMVEPVDVRWRPISSSDGPACHQARCDCYRGFLDQFAHGNFLAFSPPLVWLIMVARRVRLTTPGPAHCLPARRLHLQGAFLIRHGDRWSVLRLELRSHRVADVLIIREQGASFLPTVTE